MINSYRISAGKRGIVRQKYAAKLEILMVSNRSENAFLRLMNANKPINFVSLCAF